MSPTPFKKVFYHSY